MKYTSILSKLEVCVLLATCTGSQHWSNFLPLIYLDLHVVLNSQHTTQAILYCIEGQGSEPSCKKIVNPFWLGLDGEDYTGLSSILHVHWHTVCIVELANWHTFVLWQAITNPSFQNTPPNYPVVHQLASTRKYIFGIHCFLQDWQRLAPLGSSAFKV